ncbi:DUF3619 family protein [Cupriavidus sp. AU9028]|uniref:DUF3619 family protein n=1 Tax=Cupriavidus sp. AU9028 TaxID=2871157 RepID=UPI001C980A43|nr:DUF3619 family protein [Cupriavidus sp. AU9028]MBY4895736.1 DUF3619 family protein [Cupriavidus sp. AU9028]
MNSREPSDIRERRLAIQVRTALEASAGELPPRVQQRLAAARQAALARRKAPAAAVLPRLASAGGGHQSGSGARQPGGDWFRRLGLVWTLLALVAGLAGIYEWHEQQQVEELADVDEAMLLDELPPAAYADSGFHVFLKHGE